ncbi:FMN-binding protein [Mesoterricola silvestris]|uniref:FMN-binding domain-containing protein n=1 Tax=Mesoterricola silvestris TaxID=2927979 RepID=A0AA48GHM0_9BACT|nr:FMN-binding protein [Mesoterricola silvestris]BDU73031.1 hypothetical protein METEAL_22050 [Mesoterricola silvestris]
MRRMLFLAALPLAAALPSPQEALALAFPGAALTRRENPVAFEARSGGRLVGVAFLDTHRVRTQTETAMVAIGADGRILRVEVVAFSEPPEYMARGAWLRQFDGRRGDLVLGRTIKPLAGATLTAAALTDAGKRALAQFQALYGGAK